MPSFDLEQRIEQQEHYFVLGQTIFEEFLLGNYQEDLKHVKLARGD